MAVAKVKLLTSLPIAAAQIAPLFSRPTGTLSIFQGRSSVPAASVFSAGHKAQCSFQKKDIQRDCLPQSQTNGVYSTAVAHSFHLDSAVQRSSSTRLASDCQKGLQKSNITYTFRGYSARKCKRELVCGQVMAQSSSEQDQGAAGEAQATGKYAIFVTGHANPYTEEKYGGYGQLLESLLKESGETWEKFVVLEGQFPSVEQLSKFDGIVLTGSRHDAHSDEPWILQLLDVLKEAHSRKQRILGICFGHQVLCRALGGTTGRSTAGWEMGLREIKLDEKLRSKPYARGLPPVIRVYESHQDQVSAIPPGGELLGSSARTPIEIFSVGDVALGVQGHPEFNLDVLTDLIEDRRTRGVLTEEEADQALESAYEANADTKLIQELCIAFLKDKTVGEVQPEKSLDEELEKQS